MVTRSFHDALWPGASASNIADFPQLPDLMNNREGLDTLFSIIRSACNAFGYNVLIAELAFFSDFLEFPYGVEATYVQSVAARVKAMMPLVSSSKNTAPYYRAFQDMLRRQPIGGHPNLWGAWKDGHGRPLPRIGYVAFSNSEIFPDPTVPPPLPSTQCVLDIGSSDEGRVPLEHYPESAEHYFKEFISLVADKADTVIGEMEEADRDETVSAMNRLKASSFVSMAVGRIRPTKSSNILSSLSNLGLSGTRGIQLLLFVEADKPPSATEAIGKQMPNHINNQNIDRIACTLHKLLLELAHDESNTIGEEVSNLLGLQHVLIHDSSGLLHAIDPGEITRAIASGSDQFFSGLWDCDLVTFEGISDDSRKQKLQAILRRVTTAAEVAKQNLRILELRLKSRQVIFEQDDLQPDDKNFFEHVVQLCQSFFLRDPIKINEARDVRSIIIPAGYIHLNFLIPVVFEIMENFRRYGDRPHGITLTVRKEEGDIYQFDFSNVSFTSKAGLSKYDNFIKEFVIEHFLEGDRYIQRLTLHPFVFENHHPVALRGAV